MDDNKNKVPALSLANSFERTCAELVASAKFAPALLGSMLLYELMVQLVRASERPFWFDELLTFHMGRLEPFSVLWQALGSGADGMTLYFYVLIRIAKMIPGDPLVIYRLPSIVGYLLTLLGVYRFAGKRLPAIAGLAAAVLVALSPIRDYAVEARSYSMTVGLFATSAVLWQRIGERRFATILFIASLTLAASLHPLAIVAVSSFVIAEIAWSRESGRIRWGVWIAFSSTLISFLSILPILLRGSDLYGRNFWSRAKWDWVVSTYGSYMNVDPKFVLALIILFGLTAGLACLGSQRAQPEDTVGGRGFNVPEIILIGGFICLPALLVVLTKTFSNSIYVSKYGWPAIFGLVLGLAYLLRPIWTRPASVLLLAALLSALAFQYGKEVNFLLKERSTTPQQHWDPLAKAGDDEPGLPVVFGSSQAYLEAAEYSPPELRVRLIKIIDEKEALRHLGFDTDEILMRVYGRYVPIHLVELTAFRASNSRFIFFSTNGDHRRGDWVTDYLIENKYRLTLIFRDAGSSVYLGEPPLAPPDPNVNHGQ